MQRIATVLLILVVGCSFAPDGSLRIQIPSLGAPRKAAPRVPAVKPIVTHEFRALILEDPDKRTELPSAQLWMISGKNVRDFLKANCVQVKDSRGNMHPDFLFADGTAEGLAELKGVWKDLVTSNPPQSLPWVILSNGPSMKSFALPMNPEEFAKELETYAGSK